MNTAPSARTQIVLRRHVKRAGLLRTVQPRALATRDALLATGLELLRERDFESLSIADLAAANKLSVGSFYGRFKDKEAYFTLLQELVVAGWVDAAQRRFGPQRLQGLTPEKIVARVTAFVVAIFREQRGFIRACLKHASTHPSSWTPLKQVGAAFAGDVAALLAPRLEHLARSARQMRVRFAMQMLYGTLVNAVLNDPGPFVLANPRLQKELARAMAAYLDLGVD
jgi:AcrR family transcriptional regulator